MSRAAVVLAAVAAGLVSGCSSAVPGVPVPPTVDRESPGPGRKVFDKSALESGVKKVLTGSYGVPAEDIESVECPANQEVKVGNTFTCEVRIGGQEKVVDVRVRTADSANEYEVGTPRDR